MGITDINNAATAQNALTARIAAFLDTVDADIAARLNQADADLASRQAAYDTLVGDLVGDLATVVKEQMKTTVTFDPSAPAADLTDGGVFRDWSELITLANSLTEGATLIINMTPGDTLLVDDFYNASTYGDIHFRFMGTSAPIGTRAVLKFLCYDKVSDNKWQRIDPGPNGSVNCRYVDLVMDPDVNGALSASYLSYAFHATGSPFIKLDQCSITGPAETSLVVASGGGMVRLGLHATTLDGVGFGLGRYSTHGMGIISAHSVSAINGAALHSPNFTLGEDLLVS